MAAFKRGEVWWYKFYFAGRLIRESTKSTSKTVAKDAEKQRRRELEAGFNNITETREQRIRSLREVIDECLDGYRLRYPGATNAWKQAGATVIPVPIDDDGISLPKEDSEHVSPIYVTPSHQFPLGTCMSLARRLALLRAACDANSRIVEDDYDAEFRYTSAPRPSLQSLDENRRVIYIGSFSKTLFPALGLGYVVLPPPLVERFAA